MSIAELLEWQWQGYHRYHQTRTNLLIHIVAVPVFLVSNILVIVALVSLCVAHIARLSLVLGAIAIGSMALALLMEGRGHGLEPVPPEPFTSKVNAVGRLFLEQWITFPRFVVSGGWLNNLRQAIS